MTKECLWYNGEFGYYELLDFDPNGLTCEQILANARDCLYKKYQFEEEDWDKVSKSIYLIDIDNLKRLIE